MVDGIRQDEFYYESLNLLEVESIVVLKDAVSKAIIWCPGRPGRDSDKHQKRCRPVIRKSGSVREYSISQPRALPNYLNAADYMKKFDEAQLNDGMDPLDLKFSQILIDSTRCSSNRTRYPDNNFYSEELPS